MCFDSLQPNAVVNAFSEIFCDGIDSNQTTATVWDFLKTMKGVTEFAATLREVSLKSRPPVLTSDRLKMNMTISGRC